MSLYYVFDCLGAAQTMGRGKNILDEFKDGLTSEELRLIKKTWIKLNNKTKTIPYFNLKIFSELINSVSKLENFIIQTTKDNFLKENLSRSLTLIDKLLRPRFNKAKRYLNPPLLTDKIETALNKTKTHFLLEQFRSFLGSYVEKAELSVQVALIWQPEYSSSSAIKPNLVILGVSENFNIWGLISTLFHEAAHLQYEPFSGKMKLDLMANRSIESAETQSDFLMTFNEGLATIRRGNDLKSQISFI